jgi:hypothetical protein
MAKDAVATIGRIPNGMDAARRRMSTVVHECYPGAPRDPKLRFAHFDARNAGFRDGRVKFSRTGTEGSQGKMPKVKA